MLDTVREIVAPEKIRCIYDRPSIFLAGSIDQGQTEDWQSKVTAALRTGTQKIIVLNPRRADWDKNSSDNDVRNQIYWELDALESAHSIIVYFHPDSLAPISLLELGLFARSSKVVVVCPPGYWRRVNVEVVCRRFGIDMHDDLGEGMKAAVSKALSNFTGRLNA